MMGRQAELDKLACERDGRLMADGCSECEENLEDAYLRLTTLVESCSARNAKDVDEIERLTTEGEIMAAAIDRAIVAISTLPDDALGYGYAQDDSYQWPFLDELLDQLRAAVSGKPD